MTIQHVQKTLNDFNEGGVTINGGKKWVFVHGVRWHPVHAFVARWHRSHANAGDSPTHNASVFL